MKACYPKPEYASGAVLGPLAAAVHPSGVGCFASGAPLQHLRADTPEGLVDRLEMLAPGAVIDVVAGPAIYGGLLFDHFGHVLAEGIHRLWAAHVFPEMCAMPIAFQVNSRLPRAPWLNSVMQACGVAGRCIFVDRPTRFEALHIPAQGRALASGDLFPGYSSLFPLAPISFDWEAPQCVYVSRSRHGGGFDGEEVVDAALVEQGFAVIHPELMPLPDVLCALRSASLIVFPEGSAIHNLELIGPVDATVLVVARRPGVRERFGPLLGALARKVDYFTAVEPGTPLALLDHAALIEWILERARSSNEERLRWIKEAVSGFAC